MTLSDKWPFAAGIFERCQIRLRLTLQTHHSEHLYLEPQFTGIDVGVICVG